MIELIKEDLLNECLNIMKQGYENTAIQFGMTEENCPYRGRTCLPYEVLKEEYISGYVMYVYRQGAELIGFLSLRTKNQEMHISDIVIIPAYQNRGAGSELMRFTIEQAKAKGCSKIVLGMIHDNIPLRSWYEKFGFITTKLKRYEKVTYTVGTMELSL